MYNNLQGVGGDMFNSAEKLGKDDAIRKHFNIEYNGNELQGSDALADNNGDGRTGRQGRTSEPSGGEQSAQGEQSADSRGRTERDNRERDEEVDTSVSTSEDNVDNSNDNNQPEEKEAEESPVGFDGDILSLANRTVKNAEIAEAETQVDTNPTEAQKEAGNYKKGHVTVQGFDISIEQPKGSTRSGVDENGKTWSTEMKNTYGYTRRIKKRCTQG
ncbi:MAG: hypothetical protein LBI60_02590 [Bacteroidales bacterium]|nr:hypothetical protein [Bacteroidales bacterium]